MSINLNYLNIREIHQFYRNVSPAQLTEHIIEREEGKLSNKGSVVINTGKYTGRSAKDRFIVKDGITEGQINWGETNIPIDEEVFDKLYRRVVKYLKGKDL